jgi:hypothetical protein
VGQRPPLQVDCPKLPVLIAENRMLIFSLMDIWTSFQSATSARHCMQSGVVQVGHIPSVLLSPYVNDMPTPSGHVVLALNADDRDLVATARKSSLIASYVGTCLGTDYGTGAPRCSLLILQDTSKSSDQFSFLESQYSGPKQHRSVDDP